MKILHLNVKKCYFDQVLRGEKKFEYRLTSDYWRKRLQGVEYDEIHYKCGYPKKDDLTKIIVFPYLGYELQTITHEHFGKFQLEVFAIKLEKPQ